MYILFGVTQAEYISVNVLFIYVMDLSSSLNEGNDESCTCTLFMETFFKFY